MATAKPKATAFAAAGTIPSADSAPAHDTGHTTPDADKGAPDGEPADTPTAPAPAAPAAPKFKITKRVTLPLFKWVAGVVRYYRPEGEMFIGKEINEKQGGGAKKKEPAVLMNVTDLETGEMGQIIIGTVLKGILDEEYPNHGYVGKNFAMKQRKIPGKDYNGYDIAEVVEAE